MYWFKSKEKRTSRKTDTSWLKDALGNNKYSRRHQPIEVYQMRNKESIAQHVKAEIDKKGATTNKERMTIRRQVVSEMWQNEDDEVVAEIMDDVKKQKEENILTPNATLDVLKRKEPTPKEYDQ